jgi:hypothetical protein
LAVQLNCLPNILRSDELARARWASKGTRVISRAALAGLVAGVVAVDVYFLATWSAWLAGIAIAGILLAWLAGKQGSLTLWIEYLSGFALFIILRSLVADAGRPVFWAYPIHWTYYAFPVLPLHWLQRHVDSAIVDWAAILIYLSYFLIPPLVGMCLVKKPEALRRYVAAILLVFAAALVVHFIAPTSPPWLAARDGHIGSVKRILWNVLHPLWPQRLEDGYRASQNDYAAMPSVHIALTVLAALAGAKERQALRFPAAAYVFAMTFSVVYLGEHYLVDALAGGILALLAWAFASSINRHKPKSQ